MLFQGVLCAIFVSIINCELSKQFGSMVFHLTDVHPNEYNRYGCWCGNEVSNSINVQGVDETDYCCKIQTECYSNVVSLNSSCADNGTYRAIYHGEQVQCVDDEDTLNYQLCKCDRDAAMCLKRALPSFNVKNREIDSQSRCQQPTTTTESPFGQFTLSQIVNGQTVTCSAVDNNNTTYTECSDLKRNGLYFPNGISCGPTWSSVNSKYSDTVGFCRALTKSSNPRIEVFYTCDEKKSRSVWKNGAWSTFEDNGFTQHLRCFY